MKNNNGITIDQLESVLGKFNEENKKNLEEVKDQFLAVVEELKDSIQIVAEGVSVIRKDLNEFKEETRNNFKSFENRMDKFKKEFFDFKVETKSFQEETRDNFKAVFEWQNSFSDNFDEEIADIKRELKEIKIELAKRPTGKAFEVLESRITKLENRVDEVCKVRVC